MVGWCLETMEAGRMLEASKFDGISTMRPKEIVRHEDAHGNIGEPQEGDEAPP